MSDRSENPCFNTDIQTEYQQVATFHNDLVKSRFTIAGLYVASIGFIGSAVLTTDASWISRAGGSLLACWITFCLWILELRSRSLYRNIAH